MNNLKFSIIFFNIFLILFALFPVDYYFAARKNPKTLVFNNKIFVIGGDRGYSGNIKLESDDIWTSNYGDTWEKLTKNFVAPSRIDFSCVVFKSKMWLIGGYDQKSHKLLNDIWISDDGKNWDRIVKRASFSPRIKANLIVYKDKLWLVGGSSNDGVPFSDVWSSDNGYEWVKTSENHEINSIYASPIVIFKDKMYYFSYGKGIYSTENGSDWEKIDDENKIISDRSFYTVEVFNNSLYVICGQLKSEDQYFTALTNEV
ncbi:MAG TPA: hypothetical protein PLO89_00285 [Spirochaetota bacterium]|nr:hypothetical protein [Spirochaetota bacterium]